MVGASLTAFTVNWKVSVDDVSVPSLTAKLSVAVPDKFACGVSVIAQLVVPFSVLPCAFEIPEAGKSV